VLVLPSLMEGFGLPAVEAAACGCPVIATTASPLPQLLGTGGLYVDPLQPNQLEQALAADLTQPELRLRMRDAGLHAVRRLTWQAAAQQLHAILVEAAA
jgi:glycosyltransferase involved in cell wall biosynthesis